MAMNERPAVVFGASGGIGAALVEHLGASGRQVWAVSRSGNVPTGSSISPLTFDIEDEASILAATRVFGDNPPSLAIVATGVLSVPGGPAPEKTLRDIHPDIMARIMRINAIGPMLIAKHLFPLLPRTERALFAALSARVGSIGDNRLGGWHSYRASKAALNMLVRNLAIELGRSNKQAIAVALHPGTVDTALSQPFQRGLPPGQLVSPAEAAGHLLAVIDGLVPQDSGNQFDWRGERIDP